MDDVQHEEFVCGPNAVESLLSNSPERVHRLVFLQDSGKPRLYELQKMAKKLKIHYQQLPPAKLDAISTRNQGVIALCHQREMDSWDLVKDAFLDSDGQELIVVASGLEDPRNLGACIRSCVALGVDALLLPAKGNCGLTPVVARTSAGALEQLTICRPGKLEHELAELKAAGYQIIGLDGRSQKGSWEVGYGEKMVLIIGGEDRGIPPYLRKQCDALIRLPMSQIAHSYNASVALSLGLYEIARSREFEGMKTAPPVFERTPREGDDFKGKDTGKPKRQLKGHAEVQDSDLI